MEVLLSEKEGWGFGIPRAQWLIELYSKVTTPHRMTEWLFCCELTLIPFQILIGKSPTLAHMCTNLMSVTCKHSNCVRRGPLVIICSLLFLL